MIRQDQDGSCAFDLFLSKCNAFHKIALHANQCCHQFCAVDFAACHGVKMHTAEIHALFDQRFIVIDQTDGAQGEYAKLGADQQRLGIGIINAADGSMALHFTKDVFKLGAERRG